MAELDAYFVELKLNGAWVDVTPDILPGIQVEYGIKGGGPLDRVASTGQMTFALRNDSGNAGGRAGYYTPGSAVCLPGFSTGVPARLRLVFDGMTYVKFYGTIPFGGIKVDMHPTVQVTSVTVLDWMENAAAHKLLLSQLMTNKRMDQIVPFIVANMPVQPLRAVYNQTQDVFPTAFDTTREQTTARAEMEKLAQSELGYVYLRHDRSYGETLVVDGRFWRSNVSTAQWALPSGLSDSILDENGDEILGEDGSPVKADGCNFTAAINYPVYGTVESLETICSEDGEAILDETGGALVPDEVSVVEYINPLTEIQTTFGRDFANQIRYVTYPRSVDASPNTVLFSVDSAAIVLAPGETKNNILGRYRDPVGGAARVSGKDLQTPASGTDYAMNSKADGTGTDLTAYLTVSVTYGTEGLRYSLTNTHGSLSGYITKLQARGRMIATYDPVTLVKDDSASQQKYGVVPLDLDLKYQQVLDTAASFASVHLNVLKTPTTDVDSVTFCPNYDVRAMVTFLEMEPGMKFSLTDDPSGVSGDYFVHWVQFLVYKGLIECTWTPAAGRWDVYRFWYLGTVGKSELGVNTFIGF